MSGEVEFATGHVSGRREANVHSFVHLSSDRALAYVVLVPPKSTSQNRHCRPVGEYVHVGLLLPC